MVTSPRAEADIVFWIDIQIDIIKTDVITMAVTYKIEGTNKIFFVVVPTQTVKDLSVYYVQI